MMNDWGDDSMMGNNWSWVDGNSLHNGSHGHGMVHNGSMGNMDALNHSWVVDNMAGGLKRWKVKQNPRTNRTAWSKLPGGVADGYGVHSMGNWNDWGSMDHGAGNDNTGSWGSSGNSQECDENKLKG